MPQRKRDRPPFVGFYPASEVELDRLDLMCRYTASSRAHFARMGVAFLDSALVLDELARLEAQDGTLTPEQDATREEAKRNMGDLLTSMRPRPLVPVSPN